MAFDTRQLPQFGPDAEMRCPCHRQGDPAAKLQISWARI